MTKKGITIFEHFENTIDSPRFSNNSGWDAERLTKENDLMEMVPKDILKIKSEPVRNERIKQYLLECIRLYKEQYDAWNAMKAGFSKKRRVKKFKGKTRKGKRYLGNA